MSTVVEQMEKELERARHAGYQVRFEYFGGTGGGFCEFAGRKVLFVDLALSMVEQLDWIQADFEQLGCQIAGPDRRAA